MPYSTTVAGIDTTGSLAALRVVAGYTFTQVGGPHAVEVTQDEVTLDIPLLPVGSPATFSYAGSLAPSPSPAWFIALWVLETARIAQGGWLFRSGRFTTEPPSAPLEIIVAPEQLLGNAELATSIGTLPIVSGSTTITAVTAVVSGKDVALTATGTDTGLPAGDTFTYTATLVLIPSGTLIDVDNVFDISLLNQNLTFTAGVGQGFTTAFLNMFSGIILNNVSPRIKASLQGRINAGVLASVASTLNRGTPGSLPAGVVVSVRFVRATKRGGTENVIGVNASLGAFGGVLNKFPAPASSGCFIATAATYSNSREVLVLKRYRDVHLRRFASGRFVIGLYEWISPSIARFVARNSFLKRLVRILVVAPAARYAARSLRLRGPEWPSGH